MKKSIWGLSILVALAACNMDSHLAGKDPAEQIAILDQAIEENEASLGSSPPGGWQSPELAGVDVLLDEVVKSQVTKLKKKRAAILAENPQLAQSGDTPRSSGSGINLASVKVGQNLNSVSLSGRCGLPEGSVSEANRKVWYQEASKGNALRAFQNNASARAEIMGISVPSGFSSVCETAAEQTYALLPSLNQAIQSSNRLHNGNGVGLKCGALGASGATACTATRIVYSIKTVSYMCHQVCKAGK